MADGKDKIKNFFSKLRTSFSGHMDNLSGSGKSLVFTVIGTFLVMIVVCLAVFFSSVQGAEKVMVPHVVGKNLTTALLEMQQKELYPKIQLKYSDSPDDAGMILEQNPDAGAIVKAYRRVTLTVSRGAPLDVIEDFSGKNIDEVRKRLQALYAGESVMVHLVTPVYKSDESPVGTILAQFPEAGTHVIEPLSLFFVVSGGNSVEKSSMPELVGKNIASLLKAMAESKLTFDISSSVSEGIKNAKVISQGQEKGSVLDAYSRVQVELSLPQRAAESTTVAGVFKANLPEYPYALPLELTALAPDGKNTTIISMNHPGKSVTIPYEVEKGTTLTLTVRDEVMTRETVN